MEVPRSCKVAVIGAGAAGLVSARELQRQGHRVVVFEKANRVGGTWVYEPRCETDLLGLDPCREIIHSSVYSSLRTNLPRQIMGFLDYPFRIREDGDPRTFPAHGEVLSFLEDFARDFEIVDLIRFGTEVVHVGMAKKDEWVVEFRSLEGGLKMGLEKEGFEAVVVCNGHSTEPRIAEFEGIDRWPGMQVHSHNYRIPEPFKDQVVVLIGNGPSAYDIIRDISKVAKEVHLSIRSESVIGVISNSHDNIWVHSMIQCAYEDGTVMFQDGSSLLPDIILHCTGYKYHFPFLETNGAVGVDDNRVGPLYMHVFPPCLAPYLSFVGLAWGGLLFPVTELQSRWIAHVLSGKLSLPSEEEMMDSVKKFYLCMEETGTRKSYTHRIFPHGAEYLNWLAAQVGSPPPEAWKNQMYEAVFTCIRKHDQYRDDWDECWLKLSQYS